MANIIEEPSIIQKSKVSTKLLEQVDEIGQVVIHCFYPTLFPSYIRIWPTTYLYDLHSDHKSELVHAENITMYPVWKQVFPGDTYFTLVFSGLPRSCNIFDLLEHCENQDGAFRLKAIKRNKSDIYYVQL